jgi:hypothetical protein
MDWFLSQKDKCFCWICFEDRSELTEMHHIEPELKSFNIHNAIREGIRLSALKKEIKKCVTLCKNHHKAYHVDALYTDELILYNLYVFIKYEGHRFEEIDNLQYILDSLSPDQIEYVNKFYGQKFETGRKL